jgi:hypothetical protein
MEVRSYEAWLGEHCGLVNAHFLVSDARFAGWPAALWQGEDPEHPDLAVERQCDHASMANLVTGLKHPLAVDSNMAGSDD